MVTTPEPETADIGGYIVEVLHCCLFCFWTLGCTSASKQEHTSIPEHPTLSDLPAHATAEEANTCRPYPSS